MPTEIRWHWNFLAFVSVFVVDRSEDPEVIVRPRGVEDVEEQFNLLITESVVTSYATTTQLLDFSSTATYENSANEVRIVRNLRFDANGSITHVETFSTRAQISVHPQEGLDGNL